MAYEPTVWKSGDVITSTKLNKLENGLAEASGGGGGGGGTGGGVVVANINIQTGLLDKTWQEIFDAMASGSLVVEKVVTENAYVGIMAFISAYYDDEEHLYSLVATNTGQTAVANANDYPQAIQF